MTLDEYKTWAKKTVENMVDDDNTILFLAQVAEQVEELKSVSTSFVDSNFAASRAYCTWVGVLEYEGILEFDNGGYER
jgi:hypothetical protein